MFDDFAFVLTIFLVVWSAPLPETVAVLLMLLTACKEQQETTRRMNGSNKWIEAIAANEIRRRQQQRCMSNLLMIVLFCFVSIYFIVFYEEGLFYEGICCKIQNSILTEKWYA